MTDEIATALHQLDTAIAAARTAADRLRAASARPAAVSLEDGPFDRISEAAFDSGISESHLRKLCKLLEHRLDVPGGFAAKRGGRWFVHIARYRAYCAAHPRRARRTRK